MRGGPRAQIHIEEFSREASSHNVAPENMGEHLLTHDHQQINQNVANGNPTVLQMQQHYSRQVSNGSGVLSS